MKPIKVMSIFGTRPEAIKMAPLLLELKSRPEFEAITCLTAQHREMLDAVMARFELDAEYDLNIMEPGQTLYTVTAKALLGLGTILEDAKPDCILVHGDTSTTFTAALASFYAKIPVGHVEAGLRSGDKYSPYPEELNRKLVTQIADMHFAPTTRNAENLKRECITDGVFITGNTVIDAMRYTLDGFTGKFGNVLDTLDWENRRIITLTCHRRENYGEPMRNIFEAVKILAAGHPDVEFVYPVHPSPIVKDTAQEILGNCERVHLIAPLDTAEMHALMSKSYFILTDSGGIQEEAPSLGKPVLVLRRETERPEAIEAGTVRLAGVDREEIISLAETLLTDPLAYSAMADAVNPYGDGYASRRIADAILWHFGRSGKKPESFTPQMGGR